MIDIEPTAHRMLGQHASGSSYRQIGRAHGMSHEGVRQIVLREGRLFVDRVELALMIAAKYSAMGREDRVEWPTLLIQHGEVADWQTGMALFQWLCDRLRGRGIRPQVIHRSTPDGAHAFMSTLEATP